MPVQFSYPQNGWSTGKMRKRGQKPYAPDFEHAFAATAPKAGEMTPAQQVFERSRPELEEGASGKAVPTPTDATLGKMMLRGPAGPIMAGASVIQQHKDRLQEAVNQLASGDLPLKAFNALKKKLGWSGDHETGQFTDPTGEHHEIKPYAETQ